MVSEKRTTESKEENWRRKGAAANSKVKGAKRERERNEVLTKEA